MNKFPIFMYHALWPAFQNPEEISVHWLQDPQLSDPGARLYALDARSFEQQIIAIAQSGAHTPAQWAELDQVPNRKTVWITFDDGHRSNAELALPILADNGLRGIFFITTDWIGKPGFMSEEQIRQLRRGGMLIGAHGCSHTYFSELKGEALRREMTQSKMRLESILDEPVPALSLPGGRNQPEVQAMATELGYRHLFTSSIAPALANSNPLDWPRVPLTHRQPEDFVARILAGDWSLVNSMARKAALRRFVLGFLGNAAYDKLRSIILRRRRGDTAEMTSRLIRK